jgi:heptosyltransferase III
MKIIISRTDGIGDVILTLPIAGILKQNFPDCHIIFLGTKYTKPIIERSVHVDTFIDWDELKTSNDSYCLAAIKELHADVIIHVFPRKDIALLAKKARIPIRIGTTGRLYNWYTCNKLIMLSRKRSNLHEAQLNLKLLKGLGIEKKLALSEIPGYYGINKSNIIEPNKNTFLSKEKFNLIIHPKTKGSAREWGNDNFSELINLLPQDSFEIFITGTKEDGEKLNDIWFTKYPFIHNLTGKFTLGELIDFISQADGLIAASTGPLHISAAMNKITIGIYAPMRPIHPGRWAPLGENASYLVVNKKCSKCKKSINCECIRSINAIQVLEELTKLINLKNHTA